MRYRNKLFAVILVLLCISSRTLWTERIYAGTGGDNTIRFADTVIDGQVESRDGNKLVLKLGVFADVIGQLPQAPTGESAEGQNPDIPMPQKPTGEESTDPNIRMPQRPTGEESTDPNIRMPQRPMGEESTSQDIKLPQRPTGEESTSQDIKLPQAPTEEGEARSQEEQLSYEDMQPGRCFAAGSTRAVLTIGDESVIKDREGNESLLSDIQAGDLLSITVDEDGNISEILIR